ncbi:tetratricopeptide repeat protein [Paenibacillus peoriae]|uniref:Tetratricopeptide repeat protein n=1 Tax=Paenibacillus peoriae TaxID=59893 RepID=A0A7H0YAM7_9BACL|nr:tetratricopeptide repeat protein [Paenibacillus peoriae]QNR68135.1 tetratricopeptide repeat protein [Paenibacillus peoriae]
MAELDKRVEFAELLADGISTLREHPEYRTRRKKRESVPSGRSFSESYMDRIAARIGVSSNTIKSWMGQMGPKYIPSRVEDGKLLGLLWIIMEKEVMNTRWFNDLLLTTSIPVIDPPTADWLISCFRKAKVLLDNGSYGTPADQEIKNLVKTFFTDSQSIEAEEEHSYLLEHNLPGRWTSSFIGRLHDLEYISLWLRSPSPICLLTGWGGMGKTTIALEIAYACIGDPHGEASSPALVWPDLSHVIWVSAELRNLTLNDFLDTIAYQLGRSELLEKLLNEKRLVVRNVLASAALQKPLLLIIDSIDMANNEIHEFVATVPPGVKILLTARENHSLLHALSQKEIYTITLNGLEPMEALTYFKEEVNYQIQMSYQPAKKERLNKLLTDDEEALQRLIMATAGNPKAISLIVADLADDDIQVSELINEIARSGHNLSSLFSFLFGRSWERCTEEARRLWQTFGFFSDSTVEDSWANTAGLNQKNFYEALRLLRSFSLVETERSNGRLHYQAHQTVLTYGEQHLNDNPELEKELRRNWSSYYLSYLDTHLKREQPTEAYWSFLLGRDLAPVKSEWPNILKLLKWADNHDSNTLIQIMLRITHFLSRINLETRTEYCIKAAKYASSAGNPMLAAMFYIDGAGWSLIETGENENGLHYIGEGLNELAIMDQSDPDATDLKILGEVLKARCYLKTGQLDVAQAIIRGIIFEPYSPLILHRLLLVKGEISSMKGNFEEATAQYEQANEISRTYGGEKTIEAYFNLGVAYVKQAQYEKAESAFELLLYDKNHPNQIELIYYQYGTAQLLAGRGLYNQAVMLILNVLTNIESWGRLIDLKQEVDSFYKYLRSKLRGDTG